MDLYHVEKFHWVSCPCQLQLSVSGSILRWLGRDTDVSRTFLASQTESIGCRCRFLSLCLYSICVASPKCSPERLCAGVYLLGRTHECKDINPRLGDHKKRERGCQLPAGNSAAGLSRRSPPGKTFRQNNWESCKDNFPMEPQRMPGLERQKTRMVIHKTPFVYSGRLQFLAPEGQGGERTRRNFYQVTLSVNWAFYEGIEASFIQNVCF